MRRARDALVADAPSPRKMGLRLIRDPVDVDPRRGDRRSQSAGDEVPARIEQIRDRNRRVRVAVGRQLRGLVDSLRAQKRPCGRIESEEDVYPHRAARSGASTSRARGRD